jgi:hypothetical protein
MPSSPMRCALGRSPLPMRRTRLCHALRRGLPHSRGRARRQPRSHAATTVCFAALLVVCSTLRGCSRCAAGLTFAAEPGLHPGWSSLMGTALTACNRTAGADCHVERLLRKPVASLAEAMPPSRPGRWREFLIDFFLFLIHGCIYFKPPALSTRPLALWHSFASAAPDEAGGQR